MRRLLPLLFGIALLATAAHSQEHEDEETVLPGWDLFSTILDETWFEPLPDVDEPFPPVESHCGGVPIGTYDFPGVGPTPTGRADTIVRRLQAATKSQPTIDLALVSLQLACTVQLDPAAPPSVVYVTLQDDRGRHPTDPEFGPASGGTLTITFGCSPQQDPACEEGADGTASSELTVHYDVRILSLYGPIIQSASITFAAVDSWVRDVPPPFDRETFVQELLHLASNGAHGVQSSAEDWIEGVNSMLDGASTGSDFHYGGFLAASPSN